MKQERESIQTESNETTEAAEGEIQGNSFFSRAETILPSPFFSAVIALTCAAILLII